MENTKRARKEKSWIRPSGETYVEPKDLLSGLERVREAADPNQCFCVTTRGRSPVR